MLSEFVYNYQIFQNPHKKHLIKEEQLAETRKKRERTARLSWAILNISDGTAILMDHFILTTAFLLSSFIKVFPNSETPVYQNPQTNKLNLYKVFLILLRRYSLHEASSI